MPNVYVDGPPLDLEAKRSLTREITDAAVKAYSLPAQVIVVVVRENPAENVSVGGCLLCDARSDMTE